ncbi:MAG: YihY/virulence factor BrkB family protein [Paludibacteraceae bacterium]|jgi:membrane protein|nr:YihY/virulence factor BrkB family protein [Paludibacteraceae bacterium]
MKKRLHQFREFIHYDLWRQPHIAIHAPRKRFLYRTLQTIILVARGFKDQVLVVRANSLSFSLLFAFIPMMALIYAIARGFGFEQILQETMSTSFLAEANIAPVLLEWIERYLETARDGLFLGIGLIVLIWAVYAFFNMLENSFNSIWNVKLSRSFGRRLTNYLMTLLLVPVLVVVTSGISIFLNSTEILSSVLTAIEPIRKFMLRFLPFVATTAVFTWIFIAIPNTKVKFSSAIIPGIVMGLLYQFVQALSMYLVVLFTRMSIVYGAFSVIPLILIWLNITCWLLLIGAELAFAIQNNDLFAYEKDIATMSRRYKDYVMLYLLSVIIRRFEAGEQPQTAQEMAAANQLPIRMVQQLLSRLEETNILHRVHIEQKEEQAFVPALDTKSITVEMVIGRISAQGTEEFLQHTPKEMQAFWQRYLEMIAANPSDDILVSELA